MKNKKGWIRIVEAFIAILIIMGALLIVLNNGTFKKDISGQVYDSQISVLREIERNSDMRSSIVNLVLVEDQTVEWASFKEKGLGEVYEKIKSRTPSYLICVAKICKLDKVCELSKYEEKNVYAQAIAIAATSEHYNPKQLKMFCWEK